MKKQLLFTILSCIPLAGWAQSGDERAWSIRTEKPVAEYYAVTLANGMIGILPGQNPLSIEKIVLNGVYDRYGRGNGVSNIVQGIDFLGMELSVDGKNIGSASSGKIADWSQQLNMQTASFSSSFVYDNKIKVEYTDWALRHLPYNGMVKVKITALNDVAISVANKFKESESTSIKRVDFETIRDIQLATAIAVSPTGKQTIVASNCFLFSGNEKYVPDSYTTDNKNNSHRFSVNLKKGKTFEFALIGATCSTAQFSDPTNEAKRLALFASLEGVEKLIKLHNQAWEKLWRSDIEIEGDLNAQRDVRFALYNLYSFVREETAYSLSPMGLSGIGYNGHIFWDCETWMFPPLLMMHPEIAKSLLEYRFERLQQAKKNAVNHGYKGAMFPWESAEDGSEETPVWALMGPYEHHITADIGNAFWSYFLVTKDTTWLKEKGYPVLKEVADFWVSRVTKNTRGEYEIKNIVCADEYAENVDNNAFTNGAAIVVLRNAAQAAKTLGIKPCGAWVDVAANIPIRKFENGILKEHETYNGETIKQADANLLTFPLALITDKNEALKNLDYYVPKVDKDGPAMTFSIFSVIASQYGEPEKAYNWFKMSYEPNRRPPFGVLAETATSKNPYFTTGAGGLLQSVLSGFGGLVIAPDGIIQQHTNLPSAWKSLTIKGVGMGGKSYTIK